MSVIYAIAAIVLYAGGLALRWQQRKRSEPSFAAQILTLAGLLMHGVECYTLLVTPAGIDLSLVVVSNLVAVVLVAVLAMANVRLPVANLYIFLLPVAIVVLLAAAFIEPGGTPFTQMSGALVSHILISLAAYSALMMAALQSVMLALQERRLKQPGKTTMAILPPLETMEHLLVAMLWIGLVLLSGAILSGYLFFEDIFDQQVVHHIVLTSLSWLVYVFFLVGRYLFGWRGLTAVRWTLVAFSLLVLGYLGSKFVLEYLLHR
jgi:ABC-type uncharacterized transport system permease subunit